jgi:hypothetical protein
MVSESRIRKARSILEGVLREKSSALILALFITQVAGEPDMDSKSRGQKPSYFWL